MTQKILIASDEPELIAALTEKLAAKKISAIPAASGMDMLDEVKKGRPDLIVIDLERLSVEGFVGIKTLMRDPDAQGIPIVSLVSRDQIKELASLGGSVSDYLVKPCDLDELAGRVEWNLSKIEIEARKLQEFQRTLAARKKILLVDDDQDFADTMRIRLEKEGFLVQVVNNGEQAVTEVAKVMPDIVLLDVMIPKMDGFSVLKQINHLTGRKVPVVIMTGTQAVPEEEFRIEGARAFLRKPVDGKELLRQLKSLTS
jgi:DNA-binding response OmpR family regulator